MPRFVVLEHDFPTPHFDLMLEDGDSLRTWRLPTMPAVGTIVAAPELPRHRLAYLDYEGPIDGDRGRVIRRVSGRYTSEAWDDGSFLFHFVNCLEPMTAHASPRDGYWRFYFTSHTEISLPIPSDE